jgi:sugar phosphate isomerase/epimerase
MIHPDPQKRREGLRRLPVLAAACRQIGIPVITICTGTRDPENMWRHHRDNQSPQAWADLTCTLGEALAIAEEYGVALAFEPEVSNVVDSARQGRRLLDEMKSPQLKVVFDGANLFPAGTLSRMREILDEAAELLGPDIVIAHAKDLDRDGEAGQRPAGTGLLDYDLYLRALASAGFDGPLLLHSLAESEVDQSVKFLHGKLASSQSAR